MTIQKKKITLIFKNFKYKGNCPFPVSSVRMEILAQFFMTSLPVLPQRWHCVLIVTSTWTVLLRILVFWIKALHLCQIVLRAILNFWPLLWTYCLIKRKTGMCKVPGSFTLSLGTRWSACLLNDGHLTAVWNFSPKARFGGTVAKWLDKLKFPCRICEVGV